MSNQLKVFFLRRDVREKSLIVTLVAAAVVIWGWSFSKRATVFTREAKSHRADLAEQKGWMDRRDGIELNTKTLLERSFEPGKTLSAEALQTKLDAARMAAGLTGGGRGGRGGAGGVNFTRQPASQSGQVTVNKVQVTVTGADWTAFKTFYEAVQKLKPYANIEAPFTTTSNTVTGRGGAVTSTVTSTFNVTSVEIKP